MRRNRPSTWRAPIDTPTHPHPATSVGGVRHDRAPLPSQTDSLTVEEVARIRGLTSGAVAGHLAACLEGGLTFEWDRRRLGIDPALEAKVLLLSFKIRVRGGTGRSLVCLGNEFAACCTWLEVSYRWYTSVSELLDEASSRWKHTTASFPYPRRLVMSCHVMSYAS